MFIRTTLLLSLCVFYLPCRLNLVNRTWKCVKSEEDRVKYQGRGVNAFPYRKKHPVCVLTSGFNELQDSLPSYEDEDCPLHPCHNFSQRGCSSYFTFRAIARGKLSCYGIFKLTITSDWLRQQCQDCNSLHCMFQLAVSLSQWLSSRERI